MVEMTKDLRRVKKREDGKFVFTLDQEQIYEEVAVKNMVAKWKEQKGHYEAFLSNYEKTIEAGIAKLKEQMEQQKTKVLGELKFIEEGLTLWENPEEGEEKAKCPDCGKTNVHYKDGCLDCKKYQQLLKEGLSDAEARATVWPKEKGEEKSPPA